MNINLLDGSKLQVNKEATVKDVANKISTSLGKATVGAVVNDNKFLSINDCLNENDRVKLITEKDIDMYNNTLRSSARLIVSKALIDNYEELKVINYEFDFDRPFLEGKALFDMTTRLKIEELKKIQLLVDKTISKAQKIEFVSNNVQQYKDELLKSYRDTKYIAEIIDYSEDNPVNVVKIKDSYFVTYYPYIENISNVKISLLAFAGEYWRNDASNPMIQCLSFVIGKNEAHLTEKLNALEELKNSDHRYIGKNLEIFTIDPLIGQGLPIWLPNGTILKEAIKKYIKEKEWEYEFIHVESPVIGTSDLYKISGHWDHYKDDMFAPMELPKEQLVLRPMACPHHIQIFKSKQRTYKELPLRIAEHAHLYRYESSGSLTGLERVRSMELTDSHIFVRRDQIKEEFMHCYKLIVEVLAQFDIKIDYISLSLRDKDNKDKFFDDDIMWDAAEKQLEEVLVENNIEFKKMIGEAAFYGPKLDIQIRTVLGHEITVSTLQLDFLLPTRFEIEYINSENTTEQPIIIHRGLIGTFERFIATLLEQTRGVLPVWLAPNQVSIIPVTESDDLIEYCDIIHHMLRKQYLRSSVDKRNERLNYKIRDAQIKKIPYQLIIGKEELDNKTVSYRKYGSEDSTTIDLDEFIKMLEKQDKERIRN